MLINKKIILKIFLYLISFILLFTLFELLSFDKNYINKSFVTFNVDNVRNPQIKKIVRTVDNLGGELYLNLSKKKQDEFYKIDLEKYNNLPNVIEIKTDNKNLTISNNEKDLCFNCNRMGKIIGVVQYGKQKGNICVKCFKANAITLNGNQEEETRSTSDQY